MNTNKRCESRRPPKFGLKCLQVFTLSVCGIGDAFAQRVGVPTDDLSNIGVDELFNLPVTSVGRKAQELSKAPAAVFVLTAEDIKRSGATSIPEALQWVPGLTVLRIDGRSWSVSARGSARQFANKMLVMIDGRSLYTPLFAGVIWDAVDTPLEDIERIEVVRGPVAVMWGPNAVNGVINIITKNAKATKGLLVSVASGNELKSQTTARFGSVVNERFAYRVWGKEDYSTPAVSSPGTYSVTSAFPYRGPPVDNLDRSAGRLGFRLDGQPDEKDVWLVQGDLYKSSRQDTDLYAVVFPVSVQITKGQTDYHGGYVQGLWTHTASPGNESTVQFSYARDYYAYPFIQAQTSNLTVDFQNRRQTGARNEVYWGAGYQQYQDSTVSNRYVSFNPAHYLYRAGDAVIRDEYSFVPGRLVGSAGMRIDYTSYGHLEYQPSLRLLYTPNKKESAWISASRAVRLPSRFERDLRGDSGEYLIGGVPIAVPASGSTTVSSEVERSLEAGYRFQSGQTWSIDASVFLSSYSRLVGLESSPIPVISFAGATPTLSIPSTFANPGAGLSRGGEIWGTWQVRHGWRLMPSYSYIDESRRLPPNGPVHYAWNAFPSTIPHQAALRSQHDLSRRWKLDLMARVRSRNTALDLPGVLLLDTRLSWKPSPTTEFSMSLKNLTNRRVVESYPEGPTPAIPTRMTFVMSWIYTRQPSQ